MHPRESLTALISSLRNDPLHRTAGASPPSNPLLNAPDSVRKALLTLHVLFPHELLPALDLLDRNLITRIVVKNCENGTESPPTLPSHRYKALAPRKEQQPPQTEHRDSRAPDTSFRGGTAHQSKEVGVPPPLQEQQTVHGQHDYHLDESGTMQDHENSLLKGLVKTGSARHADAYLVRSSQAPPRARADAWMRDGGGTTTYEVRLQAWSCSCPAFAFAAFPASEKSERCHPDLQQRRDWQGKLWKFGGLSIGSDMPVCKHLLACVLVEHGEVFADIVEERKVSKEELAGWAAGWGD